MQWPALISEFAEHFQQAFTKPTLKRMGDLLCGALIKNGKRTFTSILAFVLPFVQGHFTNFYRLFSRPAWSMQTVGKIMARLIVDLTPPGEPVVVLADSTANSHPGRKVYGKGKHRDAVRSSHSHTVHLWGHCWMVLAVAVALPGISRRWALPVLMALYRPPKISEAEEIPHKTPVDLARQLMNLLLRWFPDQQFILVVDGGMSSHELAGYARKHRKQLTLIGKFYPRAALHKSVGPYPGNGRPAQKGAKLPKPEEVVKEKRRRVKTVSWYGGKKRRVGLKQGTGLWYRSGQGVAAVKWIYVEDLDGTHRDEYFFSTNKNLSAQRIVELYTLRWSLEVTFQESRQHLGFGSRRVRTRESVLRSDPWLLMLYSVVSYLYLELLLKTESECPVMSFPWYKKQEATFSDALLAVRSRIWDEWLRHTPEFREGVQKLSPECRDFLLFQLTMSA